MAARSSASLQHVVVRIDIMTDSRYSPINTRIREGYKKPMVSSRYTCRGSGILSQGDVIVFTLNVSNCLESLHHGNIE